MRWLPFRRRSGWRPSSLRLTVQTLRCLTFRGSIDIQFQQTHETMNLVFHLWCFVLNRSPISGRSRSPSVVSGTLTSPGYLMIAGGAMPNISGCVGINSYDNSARQAFHNLLETARDHYENKLLRVAGCLAEKVVWAIDPNKNLIRLVASELIFFFFLDDMPFYLLRIFLDFFLNVTSDEEWNEKKYFSLGLVAGLVTGQRGSCTFTRLSRPHSSRPAAQSIAGRFSTMRSSHLGRASRWVVGSGWSIQRSE